MATALARSITLPPPTATTRSARWSRAAATASRARSTVGSARTRNVAHGMISVANSSACRSGCEPAQISALDPSAAVTGASSAARPGPNTTRPAVANSNGAGLMASGRPAFVFGREDRPEPRGGPRLGHHLGDRLPPVLIVRRVLVRGRGGLVAVDLDQDDLRRIGLVLDDVEPQHARLVQRRPRVDQRRREEVLDPIRPNPHLNMYDQHPAILAAARSPSPPVRRRGPLAMFRGTLAEALATVPEGSLEAFMDEAQIEEINDVEIELIEEPDETEQYVWVRIRLIK